MKLVGIFNSIQGEGCNMGIPCTFVRLYGCNLHCSFCDEKQHKDATLAYECTPLEILAKCMHKLIVVTGGEPTLQVAELKRFVKMAQDAGHIVAIESNGTYEHYDELGCYVVVSPKAEAMYAFFPSGVAELKYVVTKEFNADVAISESVRERFNRRIWLQPCDYDNPRLNSEMKHKAVEIAMKDERLRVGCQLHKILEVL